MFHACKSLRNASKVALLRQKREDDILCSRLGQEVDLVSDGMLHIVSCGDPEPNLFRVLGNGTGNKLEGECREASR